MKSMNGWGVTGWGNDWTALGSDVSDDDLGDAQAVALTGYGIRRTVDPGVVYFPQPEVEGVPRWHPLRQSRGRIFDMQWPESQEPKTRSLLDIHAAIAARHTKLVAGDADLAALDMGVELLLTAAERLHSVNTSIGFLQPDSCRVGEWRDGGQFVQLPDVGFAWDKQAGLMPPSWIAAPALGLLFEQGAAKRNEDVLAEISRQDNLRDIHQQAADASAVVLADVKILTRLIVTALVGADEVQRWCQNRRCLLNLPSRDVASDTEADIWDKVIAPALAGQITTVSELRARLKVYPPSSHFLHEPPTPPWPGWAMLRRAAMVTAAVGVIGLLSTFSGPILRWFQVHPAPFCRNVTEKSPLYGQLFELEKARDAARSDIAARPVYWSLLQECKSAHAELKDCHADCLNSLVEEWCRQADEEGASVLEQLRERPRPTPEEVQGISAAITAIRQSSSELKQPPRSAVVSSLERELKLRGGSDIRPPAGPVRPRNK